ncbi:MAG: hypothetical protein ABI666_00410 [Ferruginibacter sp.]
MKLYNFIVLFGTGIIGIAFFLAIAFAKKDKPLYYRYIFIFIILGLLLSTNAITNHNSAWLFSKKIPILIEQLLLLFQSLMLGLFFFEILKKSIFAKKIKGLLFLLVLTQIILIIVVHLANTEISPFIIPNLILLIFCFFYVRDLMSNKPTLILVKSSAFWLVMGIFFSSSIGFPVSSLIPFIPKNQEVVNLRFQIFSITNMSLIVLYLFIIKSYLCLKHPQNL